MTTNDLIKVTDALPEKGQQVLVYSNQGGYTVAKYTDWNSTYGYHYDEVWFTKSGRQMSKKTITHWAPLPDEPK